MKSAPGLVTGSRPCLSRLGVNHRHQRRRQFFICHAATEDPYTVLSISRGSSKIEIRAAYYQKMKLLHPDVNKDQDTTEAAVKLNAAYVSLFQDSLRFDDKDNDDDVFDFPQGEPNEVFVNPFACYNVSPLHWEELQNAVMGADDPEEVLRRAGAGPSEGGTIFWLTPQQKEVLIDELQRVVCPGVDTFTLEACSFYLRDCLYRARFANSRIPPG